MQTTLILGLAVSVFGPLVLVLTVRHLNVDSAGLPVRLTLWAMAATVVLLAATASPDWRSRLGLHEPGARSFAMALVGAALALAGGPIVRLAQSAFGGAQKIENSEQFRKLVSIRPSYRLFLVVTAGVTEEVLYRGYAVGIGTQILGSVWLAVLVSSASFVGAHFRWGASHLASVTWAALVLSGLFVYSGDLVACIVAHTVIDAVGLFLAPWGLAVKARREAAGAGGV